MLRRIASEAAAHIGAATGSRLSGGTEDWRTAACNASPVLETVVIVDDNGAFRARARVLLTCDGYEVIGEASGGRSGLDTVCRLRPDVALLDIQLPDMDGFAVATGLKLAGAQSAVVLVSARDVSDYGRALAGCGARGFIAKAELCGDRLRALLEVSV